MGKIRTFNGNTYIETDNAETELFSATIARGESSHGISTDGAPRSLETGRFIERRRTAPLESLSTTFDPGIQFSVPIRITPILLDNPIYPRSPFATTQLGALNALPSQRDLTEVEVATFSVSLTRNSIGASINNSGSLAPQFEFPCEVELGSLGRAAPPLHLPPDIAGLVMDESFLATVTQQAFGPEAPDETTTIYLESITVKPVVGAGISITQEKLTEAVNGIASISSSQDLVHVLRRANIIDTEAGVEIAVNLRCHHAENLETGEISATRFKVPLQATWGTGGEVINFQNGNEGRRVTDHVDVRASVVAERFNMTPVITAPELAPMASTSASVSNLPATAPMPTPIPSRKPRRQRTTPIPGRRPSRQRATPIPTRKPQRPSDATKRLLENYEISPYSVHLPAEQMQRLNEVVAKLEAQAKRAEAAENLATTKASYQAAIDAFAALGQLGAQFNCRPLQKLSVAGQQVASIAMNVTILQSGVLAGPAMICPYVAIGVAVISLCCMMFGRNQKSDNPMQALFDQLRGLQVYLQKNFEQVFKNQELIYKSVMHVLTFMKDDFKKPVITRLKALQKSVDESAEEILTHLKEMRLDDLQKLAFTVEYYHNHPTYPPTHSELADTIADCKLWLQNTATSRLSRGEFRTSDKPLPLARTQSVLFGEIQLIAIYAKQYDETTFAGLEIQQLPHLSLWSDVVELLMALKQTAVNLRFPKLVDETDILIRRAQTHLQHYHLFIDGLRNSPVLFHNVLQEYHSAIEDFKQFHENNLQFIREEQAKGNKKYTCFERSIRSLNAFYESDTGNAVDFEQYMSRIDHLYNLLFNFCLLAGVNFFAEFPDLLNSMQIRPLQFHYPEPLVSYCEINNVALFPTALLAGYGYLPRFTKLQYFNQSIAKGEHTEIMFRAASMESIQFPGHDPQLIALIDDYRHRTDIILDHEYWAQHITHIQSWIARPTIFSIAEVIASLGVMSMIRWAETKGVVYTPSPLSSNYTYADWVYTSHNPDAIRYMKGKNVPHAALQADTTVETARSTPIYIATHDSLSGKLSAVNAPTDEPHDITFATVSVLTPLLDDIGTFISQTVEPTMPAPVRPETRATATILSDEQLEQLAHDKAIEMIKRELVRQGYSEESKLFETEGLFDLVGDPSVLDLKVVSNGVFTAFADATTILLEAGRLDIFCSIVAPLQARYSEIHQSEKVLQLTKTREFLRIGSTAPRADALSALRDAEHGVATPNGSGVTASEAALPSP